MTEGIIIFTYTSLKEHDAAIRNATLNEFGTMLNSKIAKMEIICSKSSTPLRQGILMAYREVEGWERAHRTPTKEAQEDLNDDDKPGCFGGFGYINSDCRLPCVWLKRCRQSQEDY